MHRIKIAFRVLVFMFGWVILHYALPQHDIVRVVNTYQERQDLNDWTRIFWARPDDQSATIINRDVQFIQTVKKKTFLLGFVQRETTEVMVYRNEDTGWSWPFYFKFDTASLQTEADDLRSTPEQPKWAVVTHYGWRNEYFSAFPNAIAIRPVEGPNVTIIPWFNIAFFVFLMVGIVFIRAMWRQFRERTVDPLMDSAGHRVDEVQADMAERKGRVSQWLGTWRSKK
ncbi:DUF1523 family protein [Yoonia maritima]|uniref:DUF1523 family protein n=1 Tax=Yoonia maritima TaxID=1435347 RepID=UPI000D10DF62|nr:DUF1523 family protein [Yoonia maritima]